MSADSHSIFDFGDFRLDARRRLLLSRHTGEPAALTTKAFETLLYLVEHAGDVVGKSDLLQAVWPHVRVEENSVSQCVSAVRRALGESPCQHCYIVTVPGRGYRFIASVVRDADTRVHTRAGALLRSLAVLPFKPMTPAETQDSLGLGMTDALILRLGKLPNIEQRPLSSVRRFCDVDQNPIEAGRSLSVDAVLDGWVQRNGDRIRVSARLLDVATGQQIWADRFDEDFTDIFSIQDAIAQRVATAVLPSLTREDRQKLRDRRTENPHAYQHYVNGWLALTRLGGASLQRAATELECAVSLDPEFARSHVCLSVAYALLGVFGVRPYPEVIPKARSAVAKALAIEADNAEAHAQHGHILMVYDFEQEAASCAYRHAIELDPRCTTAHHWLGLHTIARGKFDEALEHLRRAQALEPLAANISANIGFAHYLAGRYHDAIRQLEATLEIDQGFDYARSLLGRSLLRLGEFELAITQFKRRTGATLGSEADIPTAHALCGRVEEARHELENLAHRAASRQVSACDLATIRAALGETEAALGWLEMAVERRNHPILFVGLDPAFARLRGHPRFAEILKSLGLPGRDSNAG